MDSTFHSLTDLGFASLGLPESGCKFMLSPPTEGKKMQMLTRIHTNLESQIPSLLIESACIITFLYRQIIPRGASYRSGHPVG